MDDLVESVAQAICREDVRHGGVPWEAVPDGCIIGASRCWYRDLARAAIADCAPKIAEECAAMVDCGCAHKADVLAVRNPNSGDRWRACGSNPCGALEARDIRAHFQTLKFESPGLKATAAKD